MKKYALSIFLVFVTLCTIAQNKQTMDSQFENAVFANGCFWCTEAIFLHVEGVEEVCAGYTGGETKNPTYNQVVAGSTGHAEAIEISFNTKKVSYQDLLEIFFSTHNPTTLNKQGYDVGTQYRSGIFYSSELQKKLAEEYIEELTKSKVFNSPIVTEVTSLDVFYKAEDYHQNYYKNNPNQGYCKAVINPKLEKFQKEFKHRLKKQ
jgi:peptide-methionine (S)-S-oxide reductase